MRGEKGSAAQEVRMFHVTVKGVTGDGAVVAHEFADAARAFELAGQVLATHGEVTLGVRPVGTKVVGFARALAGGGVPALAAVA